MGKSVREVLLTRKKAHKDKGGGAKKYGRHKKHCMKYRAEGRREKNKLRKARKIANFLKKKSLKKLS